MKVKNGPINLQYELPASLGLLWDALVEEEQMRKWFFPNMPDFDIKDRFKTTFEVVSGDRVFTHQIGIVEADDLKYIAYNWSYKEYPGKAILRYDLIPLNPQSTQLLLKMEITEDFPDSIPEFTRESCIAGWNYFIGDSLRSYLEAS